MIARRVRINRKDSLDVSPNRSDECHDRSSGKEKQQGCPIDTENKIAAHAAVPANTRALQLFATEKELAKLAADRHWDDRRIRARKPESRDAGLGLPKPTRFGFEIGGRGFFFK